ncbi:MAG: hypothetical protein K2N38_08665 [Oscillospiraceae bacterium]|nr:hypothetical protein [Oscillospiraceae bacterium]
MTTNNDAFIKRDRLRFTKNKLSSNLTLLAILINAFYFVSVYKCDVGTYYYKWFIGISVLYNLVFMLVAFLSSEGVKSYNIKYSFPLIAIGILQVVRIFILPLQAKNAVITLDGVEQAVMEDGKFFYQSILLVASGVLCVIAGVVNIIKAQTLASHQAQIDKETKGSKS